jgi:hypothetical protein
MKAVGGPAADIPGNVQDSFDAEEMRTMLAENTGEVAHMRANIFPNFTARGLTLGYLASQRNRYFIDEPVGSDYEVAERRDHGPVFALNGGLFGGVIKLGASATYLMRRQLYKSFASNQTVTIDDNDYRSGKALIITAGGKLTLPWTFLPTISGVIHNSSNTKFGSEELGGLPEPIKQTVDVGFSITPQISKMSRIHMEVNLKDVNDKYETDIKRRTAFGMELDFNRRIFIRGGYGDGWGSGGIGVRNRTFIFDLSTYAVDRSLDGFREVEDRRWVMAISSGI